MKIPNEAQSLALLTAFWAIAHSLAETGALQTGNFLRHAASGREMLQRSSEAEAIAAFDGIIRPLADAWLTNPPAGNGHSTN